MACISNRYDQNRHESTHAHAVAQPALHSQPNLTKKPRIHTNTHLGSLIVVDLLDKRLYDSTNTPTRQENNNASDLRDKRHAAPAPRHVARTQNSMISCGGSMY
eukprot:scpid102873/ scgid11573/ 